VDPRLPPGAEAFAAGTRIARMADARGFVALLPRQSRMANSERCWNWFDRRTAAGNGESAIVAAQTEEVIEKFGIDPARVYLAGLSSGATLAATLGDAQAGAVRRGRDPFRLPAGAAFDAHDAGRAMARARATSAPIRSRWKRAPRRARVPACRR
jgi:poly(3-hydroxybutyrate) depolymerase